METNEPEVFFRNLLPFGDPKKPSRKGGRRRSRSHKNQTAKEQRQPTQRVQQQEEQETASVVNISDFTLTTAQINLLSKGLLFCPSSHMRWFDLELDLLQFFRKLRLKVWFNNVPVTNTSAVVANIEARQQPELCLRNLGLNVGSNFVPSISIPAIDTYIDLVKI